MHICSSPTNDQKILNLKSLNLISQLRALYLSGFNFHPEPGYYYTVLQQSSLNKCNLSIVFFFLFSNNCCLVIGVLV